MSVSITEAWPKGWIILGRDVSYILLFMLMFVSRTYWSMAAGKDYQAQFQSSIFRTQSMTDYRSKAVKDSFLNLSTDLSLTYI